MSRRTREVRAVRSVLRLHLDRATPTVQESRPVQEGRRDRDFRPAPRRCWMDRSSEGCWPLRPAASRCIRPAVPRRLSRPPRRAEPAIGYYACLFSFRPRFGIGVHGTSVL